MRTVIFGLLTGRTARAEQKIEKQARAMTHTPQFCDRLDEVRQRQDRMAQSVTKLAPYAKITRQDVDDCAAGRPYKLDI